MQTRISKHSGYIIGKVIDKYKNGYFDRYWKESVPSVRGLKGALDKENINLYNCSDTFLKSGNLAYVVGCNMSSYIYEEALYYIGKQQAYVSIRGLQPGDEEDDQVQIQTDIAPWSVELQSMFIGELFFAIVKLSDDYDE